MTPIAGTPILTGAQMRAAEDATGLGTAALMQRAGDAIATAVRRLASGSPVLILCGPGNNGGDGYVAAAALKHAGAAVSVAAWGELHGDAAIAAWRGWNGPIATLADAEPAPVLVDALFGTGLSRPLDDDLARDLHRLADAASLRIAIDLPSGVATDDGAVLTEPPVFTLTLVLGAVKPSHLLQPAARYCGEVRLLDIGLHPHPSGASRLPPSPVGRGKGPAGEAGGKGEGDAFVLDRPTLPNPTPDSHKYTRGLVAIVPGTMPGAAELAAIAAMRAGAGYALLLTDQPGTPHAIVRKPFDPHALADPRIGAIVIGPGLGRDAAARTRLDAALASGRPLVIDGDALHLVDIARLAGHGAPMILTPHHGEFAALFGKAGASNKIDRARDAARETGATIVYKGADTVIAAPDGRVAVAEHANDWLSTAGTGDVLAGATGAMLASGLDPFAAASAAVWLHADAARRCGKAFLADDLAAALTPARAGL